jgi:transketolase
MRNRIMELIRVRASVDEDVLFLTGDLGFSVVEPLQEALGERFINMGIAEANMLSASASLAACGFKPYVYSIAPFVTVRCLEQIRNDVAYQKRPVRIIGVGAGFSYGSLGPSHHSLEDATLMAALPGMMVFNPANVAELDRVFALSNDDPRPAYFRIPRESGSNDAAPDFSLQDAVYQLRSGNDVTLVSSGVSVAECLVAAARLEEAGIGARVLSVPVIQPFPAAAFAALAGSSPIVTVFEGYRGNPLSLGVMETLLGGGMACRFLDLCAPHEFAQVVGNTQALRQRAGIDAQTIARKVESFVRQDQPVRRVG